MSKSTNRSTATRAASGMVEIKSKFDAEFRRFGLSGQNLPDFESFCRLIDQVHRLRSIPVTIWYSDHEGDLLPINNDNNYSRALTTARPILRLNVQRKGQAFDPSSFRANQKKQKTGSSNQPRLAIGFPEDFRQISAIIDVHIVPECHRRVRLMKNSSDRPLGFYIRDGTSIRVLPHGLEKVPAIFISRLVVGGLAESTGLLAVNDEVLEVNGIEVFGKTLDQVTDMMVANSSNLIITIKPANNHNDVKFSRETSSVGSRSSQKSAVSYRSEKSDNPPNGEEVDDDEDVVEDHTLLAEEDHSLSGSGYAKASVSKALSEKNQFSVITL